MSLYAAFISKFDVNGNEIWSHYFATEVEDAGIGGLSADPGGVYVVGSSTAGLKMVLYYGLQPEIPGLSVLTVL